MATSNSIWVPRGRGHVPAPNLKELKRQSHLKHGARLTRLPNVTAPAYDCRTLGIVPPIRDQGQCGSCWDFSGSGVCTSALIAAGYGTADGSFNLSEQMVMDCGQNGGCNGDDNVSVCQMCESSGLALDSVYGTYRAERESCRTSPAMLLYKIATWGFCDGQGDGVAATQLIKNCMVQYGPIGSGVDAGNFDSYSGGVLTGNGSSIDHDIILVGWDDTKGNGGAWLLRNSWGTDWGIEGYCWIEYGAQSVGSEAVFASATPLGPIPLPPTTTF